MGPTSHSEVVDHAFDAAGDVESAGEDVGKEEEHADAAAELWAESAADHVCTRRPSRKHTSHRVHRVQP